MPRGTCENCGQQDAFVYASPIGFCKTVFICARCLSHEWDEDEANEWDEFDVEPSSLIAKLSRAINGFGFSTELLKTLILTAMLALTAVSGVA